MTTYRRYFILEDAQVCTIQDETGEQITFESLEDLSRCTGADFSNKVRVSYDPDINHFADTTTQPGEMPHELYEELISTIPILRARQSDPTYGLDGHALIKAEVARDKERARNQLLVESSAPVEVTVTEGTFEFNGGEESAAMIKRAIFFAQDLGEESVSLSDYDNKTHTFAFDSAKTIHLTIGKIWRDAFLRKQAALVALDKRLQEAAEQ